MNIVICDDDEKTRVQIKNYLERFEKEQGISITVKTFDSAEALLAEYPQNMDILLLDIVMYEISGMDLARRIRMFDDELCIIFISNMTQYALEGYQVHAFNFMVKPFSYSVFARELSLACRKLKAKEQEAISIKNDAGMYTIPLKDILYIETLDHKLLLHTKQKEIVCYISMGQMEKKLSGKAFFRCHQSFLIQLGYVDEVRKDSVMIAGGHTIPVSRHRRRELLQAMTKYAGEVL